MKHTNPIKGIIAVLVLMAVACGNPPDLLPPANGTPNNTSNNEGSGDTPKGLHWREDIAVAKFRTTEAAKWDYSTEGKIVVPEKEMQNMHGDKNDIANLKAGDVIVVWGEYIVFIKDVITTDSGTEITVRPFVLSEAIYGDFKVPFFEKNQGIGNLGEGNTEIKFSKEELFGKGPIKGEVAFTVSGHLSFSADASSQFEGHIPDGLFDGKPRVDHLQAKVVFGMDLLLKPEASLNVKMSKLFEPTLRELKKDKIAQRVNRLIPSIKLGATGLALKPAFYIPRSLEFGTNQEGKVGVEIKANASLPLGFEYYRKGYDNHTSHDFTVIPNAKIPASFEGSFEWTGSIKNEAFMKAHIGLGLDFQIVPAFTDDAGIEGLGFETKVNGSATIAPLNIKKECTVLELYANIEGIVKPRIFLDTWFGDWEWEFLPGGMAVKKEFYRKDIVPKFVSSDLCLGGTYPEKARLKLKWTESTDLDIHLVTSEGTEISPDLGDPNVADGAKIIQDACFKKMECIEGRDHEEIIEWDDMKEGSYSYWVENFNGDKSANYEFELTMPDGSVVKRSGQISGTEKAKSEVFTFTYKK